MAGVKVQCFSCNKMMEFPAAIGRREECPHCGADVHVCRNCQHYDPTAYNECREPSAEVVREKERSNFCDHFQARVGAGGANARQAKDDLLAAAEALFKKK